MNIYIIIYIYYLYIIFFLYDKFHSGRCRTAPRFSKECGRGFDLVWRFCCLFSCLSKDTVEHSLKAGTFKSKKA